MYKPRLFPRETLKPGNKLAPAAVPCRLEEKNSIHVGQCITFVPDRLCFFIPFGSVSCRLLWYNCDAMKKQFCSQKPIHMVAAAMLFAMSAFSAAIAAYDDLADVIEPSDPASSGFWNTAGRSAVTISTATSGVAAVNGVFRTVAESKAIPIRSDKFRSIIVSFR